MADGVTVFGELEGEALLYRARFALKKGDFGGWLEARQQHARRLDPTLAALVLWPALVMVPAGWWR